VAFIKGDEISPLNYLKRRKKMAKAQKKISKELQAAKAQVVDASDMEETIPVTIAGQSLIGMFRTFTSGSKGYNVNGKVMLNGLKCQVSCNIVVIGSKPATK
jgi:hypothetical protein